jgi:hypothetical protein
MRKLFILIPLIIVSCSTEEPSEVNLEKFNEDMLEYWGDVRKDFSCTSYKVQADILDLEYEDNTNFKVTYSHNLGKQSVWVNNVLIDNNAYFNFEDETIFTIDDNAGGIMYTFSEKNYQLEISYIVVEDSDFEEMWFHCLPI